MIATYDSDTLEIHESIVELKIAYHRPRLFLKACNYYRDTHLHMHIRYVWWTQMAVKSSVSLKKTSQRYKNIKYFE